MSSLDERLKQARAKTWQKSSEVQSKAEGSSSSSFSSNLQTRSEDDTVLSSGNVGAPKPSNQIKRNDEIEALLKAMKEEVNVEQSHQKGDSIDNYSTIDSGELEGWLKSEDIFQNEPLRLDQKTVEETGRQAAYYEAEAKEALKVLQQDKQARVYAADDRDQISINKDHHESNKKTNSSTLLVVEPKEKPDLIRAGSSYTSSRDGDPTDIDKGLEDDLAAAMDDRIGPNVDGREPKDIDLGEIKVNLKGQNTTNVQEPDDLTARLARLRTENMPIIPTSIENKKINESQNDDLFSELLQLPSAPKDRPYLENIDSERNIDENDLSRDMSAFDTLARLDATKLGPPTSKNKLSKGTSQNKTDDDDDGIGNPDDWCCICNEDATIACKGCDDDLFCSSCWHEAHDDMDQDEKMEHKRKILVSKNNKKRRLVAAA